MARVRSKNQCSCCKKSSSSERPSSSTDPSYDPPSSSKDPSSSDDPSSDDPSSSSQKTSYDTGKCCAIPTDYIVDSEIFPTNQFDEAEEWIRSQRNGRENVGFLFHGPIRLRFDGGWFVAVICVGKLQDDGTCECNEYGDPESYTCEETDDPGYCYYLSGIPGLGVFTEGGDCDCGGSESGDGEQANGSQGGCDKCSDSFEPCEIGCSETGCSCCYEEPPPPGADGVACSKRFMVVSYETIQTDYPEILQDKNCAGGSFTAEENTVLGDLIAHLVEEQNIEADSIKVASFRGGDGCRVEIWGECSCGTLANDGLATCQGGPIPTVWAEAGGATGNDPDFPGISNSCTCKKTCPPDKCYDAKALNVDVFDEWQAGQVGMEWKDESCPTACSLCNECNWKNGDPDWINDRVPCVYQDGDYDLAERDAGQLFYMTRGGQDPNAGLDADCQFNQEWIDAGGYDQYRLWRWVREGQQLQKRDFDALDGDCPGTGNDDVRGFERSRARLWVCENDPEGGVIAKDITDDVIANPECLETLRVFCDGEKISRTGNGCYQCDDDTEPLSYWTEKYGDFPDWPDWTEKCPNDPPLMKDVLTCDFNREVKEMPQPQPQPKKKTKGGAGTELTKLLKFFGIEATEKGCKCKSRAAKMDKNGIEWCSNNIEKICDWLQEESKKRKLPFLRTAARVIVLRAIRNARKAEEV